MRKENIRRSRAKHHEAVTLFTNVTDRYPFSVTAQSAAMALYCIEHKKTTVFIKEMVENDQAVSDIIDAANVRHKQGGLTMHIPKKHAVDVLSAVERLAARMTRLTVQELETILRLYPGDLNEELNYRNMVVETWLSPRF